VTPSSTSTSGALVQILLRRFNHLDLLRLGRIEQGLQTLVTTSLLDQQAAYAARVTVEQAGHGVQAKDIGLTHGTPEGAVKGAIKEKLGILCGKSTKKAAHSGGSVDQGANQTFRPANTLSRISSTLPTPAT
jgi:hypothetical protein